MSVSKCYLLVLALCNKENLEDGWNLLWNNEWNYQY